MSATLLEAPRRPVAPPRVTAPSPGPEKPRPRPGRGILPIALAASAVVHILVLGIRFGGETLRDAAPAPPRLVNVETVPGIRVLDIVPVAADVPTPQVIVVRPQPLDRPAPVAPRPVESRAEPADAAAPLAPRTADPPRTVAERITPRTGDPRLWERPSDPLRPELDPLNNVRARVYGSIQAYNDSIAAQAAAAARALDWTVKDGNGGRWGVSPAGIHLGTVTLPLPQMGASAAERDRMRAWSEIQQQAGRAEVEATFEDRVRAIRARKDAARDSARRGGGGN
jgi:hypothetical protein